MTQTAFSRVICLCTLRNCSQFFHCHSTHLESLLCSTGVFKDLLTNMRQSCLNINNIDLPKGIKHGIFLFL
nr:hypothetical protein Iba_chr04cCG1820 [Ipomoea batatas]